MSSSKPASKAELKAFCLRRLGYPAVDINICDEQLDDLVDSAVSYYQDFHYEGQYNTLIKIEITQEIKDAATGASQISYENEEGDPVTTNWYEVDNYIELPPNVKGINNVWLGEDTPFGNLGNMFNIKYQLFLNDIYAFTNNQILHYFMVKNYLETLEWVTNSRVHRRLRYTSNTKKLFADIDWRDLSPGDYILVDCTMGVDPDIYPETYDEYWLKEYVTALFQKQWGQNLSKYDGIQMLGGVTLNGRKILEDANDKIKELKEELRSSYELPPFDLIG